MDIVLYGIIYIAVAALSVFVAKKSSDEKTEAGAMLARCLYSAALLSLTYLLSILASNFMVATLANATCFIIADFMLLYLFRFFLSLIYIRLLNSKRAHWVMRSFIAVGTLDVISILLNPIFGHVATYTYVSRDIAPHFTFYPHMGYVLHMLFCYIVIACSIVVVVRHALRIPHIYRSPFERILVTTLGIVALNFAYLYYFSDVHADLTIATYALWGAFVYLAVFKSGSQAALNQTCRTVLGASNQPSLIFDYRGSLFFANDAARELFPDLSLSSADAPITYNQFVERLSLDELPRVRDDKTRFYWTPDSPDAYSYICDFQELVDEHDRRIARSLVFTNNTLSVDPLTGFLTEQYFVAHEDELSNFDLPPVIMAVCDLNQLGLLNNVLGVSRGDDAIALQANLIRKHLPGRTVFVRLHDARLGALCYSMPQDEIKTRLTLANDELGHATDFSMHLKMDFAVCPLDEETTSVVEAATKATSILKTRKLLDKSSGHSNMIDSLTQMLSEIDSETESHVRRTRILGDGLAFELGLSDYERDQLSLLCLFHDIGKVGIPLQILNKPGALTEPEREIMREHVKKGYRIARATAGLEIVAESILHHHENWDGSGYPDGLQHEAIPILSRIISVVDSYDAMVSDRPYHTGISVSEACAELKRCAGTQFDPYIVDAFVRMVDSNEQANEAIEQAYSETPKLVQAPQKSDTPAPSKALLMSPVRYSRYLLDSEQRIIKADESFENLTGYTLYDVEQMQLTQNSLLFEEDRTPYWELVTKVSDQGVAYLEHRLRRKDGTGCYVYCIGINTVYEGAPCSEIIVTDITDSLSVQHQVGIARNRAMMSLRRLEENIQLDPLTNLLNKAAFRRSCERELLDPGQRYVLLMLDVDDFKKFNDTYGHPKGDQLLCAIAKGLSDTAGPHGFAGRMGGDEFSCLLKFEPDATIAFMERCIKGFWSDFNASVCANEEIEAVPTLSCGAASLTLGSSEFSDLYTQADAELYKAKGMGKNQLSINLNN